MIADFDDLCLYVYVLVDEAYRQLAPWRPGPTPVCSDSELFAMIIVGECKGWDMETELLSEFNVHHDLFPHQPSQSRFNRRRRALQGLLNDIRRIVLGTIDVALDRHGVIDSLPVPVVNFHLAPTASRDWLAAGASIGWCASKKQHIFGYKLHLLMTLGGVIVNFELAPAHEGDLGVGEELLYEHTERVVIADKGYVSDPIAAELWERNRLRLLAQRRINQHMQYPKGVQKAMNALRQIVETVNEQLTGQFNVERNHAHTFGGLCARLYSKLTAHTLCIAINRLMGKADFLQIKELAFPTPN